jgi:hypothetical protein
MYVLLYGYCMQRDGGKRIRVRFCLNADIAKRIYNGLPRKRRCLVLSLSTYAVANDTFALSLAQIH